MADNLDVYLGGGIRIEHEVTADVDFTVSAAVAHIHNEAGQAVVSGAVGVVDATEPRAVKFYYDWVPTNAAASLGDHTYKLGRTIGGLTEFVEGDITVWPLRSLIEPYIRKVRTWVQETEIGAAQANLGRRDYRDALQRTAEALSRGVWNEKARKWRGANPRPMSQAVSLTADVFEYALASLLGYEHEFSRFLSVEYPTDATQQTKFLLATGDWIELPREGVWRFVNALPVAGEAARVAYTARHLLGKPLPGLLTVSAATNATPIEVTTSAAHGLLSGDRVNIIGALGNTAANGHWTVTWVSATKVTLNGSVGNGAYTSGGSVIEAETIPAYLFESFCQFAAGVIMMGPQANAYLRTSAPEIAAGIVSYEPRSNTAQKFGRDLIESAVAAWEKTSAARPNAYTIGVS